MQTFFWRVNHVQTRSINYVDGATDDGWRTTRPWQANQNFLKSTGRSAPSGRPEISQTLIISQFSLEDCTNIYLIYKIITDTSQSTGTSPTINRNKIALKAYTRCQAHSVCLRVGGTTIFVNHMSIARF